MVRSWFRSGCFASQHLDSSDTQPLLLHGITSSAEMKALELHVATCLNKWSFAVVNSSKTREGRISQTPWSCDTSTYRKLPTNAISTCAALDLMHLLDCVDTV
jgi:hypothetical protein